MRKLRKISSVLVATLVAVNGSLAIASAASDYVAPPDGSTKAENTIAAANGAYEEWKMKWSNISKDWTQVSITPGANETEMNFAWYSKNDENTYLIYGKKSDLSDGIEIEPIQTNTYQTDENGISYESNKVTIKELESNTKYYYQVAGKEIESFTTKDSEKFSFIFVGDPQIGSSNVEKAKKPEDIAKESFKLAQYESVQSDSFNWANTLNQAMKKTDGNASFVISAGDQIQTNAKKVENNTISEIEYAGYLSPDVLKSLPVATTVGNHDADNANYKYHFNVPNLSNLGDNGYVGGDYWFTYGDALFMILNTQDTDTAEHEEFIKETVDANPDAVWRIVTFHQDIYGSGEHSNEPEIVNLRYSLIPILQKYNVDVVLTGHDHVYSRSQILKDGVKTISYTDDEFDSMFEKDINVGEDGKKIQLTVSPGNILADTTDEDERAYLDYLNTIMDEDAVIESNKNQQEISDTDGILYITGNSSSGSKYYDLVARQQTYIAARWQEDIPTYSVIDIDKTSFTINTYRADTNEAIDTTLTIRKTAEETGSSETEETGENNNIEYDKKDNTNNTKVENESVGNNNTGSELNKPTETSQNSDKKEEKSPKTGDNNNILVYLIISQVCVAAIVAMVVKRKKEQQCD